MFIEATIKTPAKDPEKIRELRSEKIRMVEEKLSNGDLIAASTLFREIAGLCMELEEFDLAMEFLDKDEMLKKKSVKTGSYYLKDRLQSLQDRATERFKMGDLHGTSNIIKQLIAIAKQIDDKVLLQSYKENLKKTRKLQKKLSK